MRWTLWRRVRSFVRTNGADADAKACGPGLPTLRPSTRAYDARGRMGARKPGSQGERAISVKTVAQGMPDDLAEPVVTAACLLFCRRAMGCGQHPAFPAPSHLEEGDVRCKARTRWRRESVFPWCDVIASAAKQSRISPRRQSG